MNEWMNEYGFKMPHDFLCHMTTPKCQYQNHINCPAWHMDNFTVLVSSLFFRINKYVVLEYEH